jgi:hypothetical protein
MSLFIKEIYLNFKLLYRFFNNLFYIFDFICNDFIENSEIFLINFQGI